MANWRHFERRQPTWLPKRTEEDHKKLDIWCPRSKMVLPNYKSQVLPFEPMCSDPKYLYYEPIYYSYEFILNNTVPNPSEP